MNCHFYSPHFLFQFCYSPPAVQDSQGNLCFNNAGGGVTYSSQVQSTVGRERGFDKPVSPVLTERGGMDSYLSSFFATIIIRDIIVLLLSLLFAKINIYDIVICIIIGLKVKRST